MAKINNKCNSNSFYKNLIYIDILCNNCIFLVFCFYILYIASLMGHYSQRTRYSSPYYRRMPGAYVGGDDPYLSEGSRPFRT